MKIALAVARTIDRDVAHNLSEMETFMREAKAGGADLVCFGEAFLQGFGALSWRYDIDKKIAFGVTSQELVEVRSLTRRIGIDVLSGYNEIFLESIYSSCALISDGKVIHNYRRISRGWKEYWNTDEHYKEGSAVEVFEYRGKKCVIGLCGDIWDCPERFALGEELLFWPVYVSWTEDEWQNGERSEYARQARRCCRSTLYVNSLCDGDAIGGAAHFLDGEVREELPILNRGLLYVEV